MNVDFVWEAQRGGPRKRRLSDGDSAEVGNTEKPPKPKKRSQVKVTKKRIARGPKEAVFAGAEFMKLAANAALPSIVPQQQGLERSPHLQQEQSYPQTASLPIMHHQHGVHLPQNHQHQTLLQSHAHPPSPSSSLASSYARNAAAAAVSAQQATAAANVAVAAAANFLRQGAPPSEAADSSFVSTPYTNIATNAAIDWHQNAAQEAVHHVANQQRAMEAIHNETQAAQAHEAHSKAQTAQAHALLQQQHAQAAQRTALAVQHQQQAAEALARFGAVATSMAAHQAPSLAVSSSEKDSNGAVNPYQAPSTMQMPPAWNQHERAAAAKLQKEDQQRQQFADNIASISSSNNELPSALPPIQPQLSVRQQIELRRRNDAAAAAKIFSNEAGSITITVPPTQKEVAACAQQVIRKSAPPVVATDDNAGIFDDAEEDEDLDFTAQFR